MSEWLDLTGLDVARLLEFGPRFDVQIFRSASEYNSVQERVPALIDTGGSSTLIDEELAESLRLVANNAPREMRGAGNPRLARVYDGGVYVPEIGHWHAGKLVGADLSTHDDRLALVLGREFLIKCSMDWRGLNWEGQVRHS